MHLKVDHTLFEEHQFLLVRELVESIRVKLIEAGLNGAKLEEATASIAFSVASTIDDTAAVEVDGTEVHPYLTFRTADDELIHCDENSFTHEFVYDVLKEAFDKQAKQS